MVRWWERDLMQSNRHFQSMNRVIATDDVSRAKRLEAFAGFMGLDVKVGPDPDQPGKWVYHADGVGCDMSVDSELEAWRMAIGECEFTGLLRVGGFTLPVDAALDADLGLVVTGGAHLFNSGLGDGELILSANGERVAIRVEPTASKQSEFQATDEGMAVLAGFLDARAGRPRPE